MNSDNYEFAKSSHPQSVSEYSPYTDKQWNYVNDINSGIYNTTGLSLVTWDLTSIYNAAGLSDVSDLFLAVPIVMVATVSVGATISAPPTAGYSLCSLKSNYQNLIHQIEVTSNGKVINDMQPFISVYENFKLLSQLSATDLKSNTVSLNINEVLDNEKSARWNPSLTATSGTPAIGLFNNLPFTSSAPGTQTPKQNTNQFNNAIYNRVSRIADVSTVAAATGAINNFYGTAGTTAGSAPFLMTSTQLNAEFKSLYNVTSAAAGGVMYWNDVAVIPLKYICDCIDKMGLVKKLDIGLRVYFNTGSVQATIINTANSAGYGPFVSNFANTCPLTINYLTGTAANGGFTNTTDALITAGVFIAKPPTTFGVGTAIGLSAASVPSHPMPACRAYYSQIRVDPQRMLTYIEENRSKQVVFENILFNQYTGIATSGTFSQLIQSGIKNPIGILIVPMISSTQPIAVGGAAFGYSQWASPYDTFPSTYSPLSLTNLQVTLGGQNVLNTTLYYTFESFLEQIQLAESLTSSDIGISVGLINQSWWEANRVYWVDLSRGRQADKETMRNLVVSFNNNSSVIIDIMMFTIYLDKVVVDVETGIVTK